jgi:hypothetical protein
MAQEEFRQWLVGKGSPGAAASYPGAINRISSHYSESVGEATDIYSMKDIDDVRKIAEKYRQSGVYSAFGYKHNGLYRAAILKYLEYLSSNDFTGEGLVEPDDESVVTNVITYERDLKSALCIR